MVFLRGDGSGEDGLWRDKHCVSGGVMTTPGEDGLVYPGPLRWEGFGNECIVVGVGWTQ